MGIKYDVNKTFFSRWSPSMAYILGFIYADGSLEDGSAFRAKYLRITSTDRDIIEKIKTTLESEHSITKIFPENKKHKVRYLLRIGDPVLYKSLLELGLHPRKSLTVKLPTIPRKSFSHFLRGYFDGDGCVYLEIKDKSFKRMRVTFTSGSEMFLLSLESKIRNELALAKKIIYKNRNAFQLSYSTKDSILLFDFMYKNTYDGLYLDRKRDKFLKGSGLVAK